MALKIMESIKNRYWGWSILIVSFVVLAMLGLIRMPGPVDSSVSNSYYKAVLKHHYYHLMNGNFLADQKKYFWIHDSSLQILDQDIALDTQQKIILYEGTPQEHIDSDSFRIEDGKYFDSSGRYKPSQGRLELYAE